MKKNKPVAKKVAKKVKSKKVTLRSTEVSVSKSAVSSEQPDSQKKGRTPSLLRGMKDITPRDGALWVKMKTAAMQIGEAYGLSYMETPVMEESSLFIRSIGRGTDVVEKEMYVFEDKDGTKVGLRPEFTASVARSYITHGLHTIPQPMKVWLWGPVFRHDRPQAGRYREFHQFDCEIMGERDPILDAETIVVAYNFLRDLGVETRIDVNSIGTREDRERYTIELVGFLRTKRSYLCEDCKRRLVKNPLRVLDCKETQCASVVEEAPQIIDWLSDASKNYFMKVLEYLDELGIPYMLRPTLVRGLDYYTDTVFEIYPEQPVLSPSTESSVAEGEADTSLQLPAQAALGGGGRYDLLVEQLGGRPTPACGFAIGLERVATMIKRDAQGASKQIQGKKRVYLAQLGEQARRKALHIIEDLRRFGVVISHDLSKASLKTQLELANRIGATHTLIIGQKEVQDGTVIIRDMESGIQEIIDQKKVTSEVKKMLES